tara:strand:- start:1226 stop:1684 length:459 start_codon:yes stop_codon:yes gene_type:complete
MNYTYIIVTILFIVCCSIAAYRYYKNYINQEIDRSFVENNQFLNNPGQTEAQLYLFYTKWCPHCKDALTVWDNLKTSQQFTKYNLNFMTIDCEDDTNEQLVLDFKIKEYPTYILLLNNKKFVYDTNLQSNTLERFLNAVYEKSGIMIESSKT